MIYNFLEEELEEDPKKDLEEAPELTPRPEPEEIVVDGDALEVRGLD